MPEASRSVRGVRGPTGWSTKEIAIRDGQIDADATDAEYLAWVIGQLDVDLQQAMIDTAIATLKGTATAQGDTLGELEALLVAEIAARGAADTALTSAITSAVAGLVNGASAGRDTLAELSAAIDALASTAAAADAANADAIEDEAIARADADTAEATTREAADNAIAGDLAIESAARADADTNEATARAAADDDLGAAIQAEATVRASADTALADDIAAEATAREAADDQVKADLRDGVAGGRDTLAKISGDLDEEAMAREAADTALDGRLDTAETTIAANTAAIAAEESAREAADTTEATARAAADDDLGAAIQAEATARASADTALADDIAAEATAREAADDQVKADLRDGVAGGRDTLAKISDDLDGEATAREAADTALDGRLDTAESTIAANTSAIAAEETAREAADTAEATARAAADDDLGADILNEATARAAADAVLSAAIEAEEAAREAADVQVKEELRGTASAGRDTLGELSDDLDEEATARLAGDAANAAAIAAEEAARIAADAALAASQAGGLIRYATWAELAAHPTGSLQQGFSAEVIDDAGTHTDPVVGGTVDNDGVYAWSASPAGWERLGDREVTDAAAQAALAAASAADAEAAMATAVTANLPSFLDPVLADGVIIVAVDGTTVHLPSGNGSGIAQPPPLVFDHATGIRQASLDNVIYLVPVTGDSWAEGSANGEAAITMAAIDAGYALMFNVGPEPNGATVTSFADLYESGAKETICSGMASKILERLDDETGEKRRFLFYVAALSGTNLVGNPSGAGTANDGLVPGSAQANELERLTRRASEIAAALSPPARVEVAAIVNICGTNDVLTATIEERAYRRGLDKFALDMNDRLRAITKQQAAIRCFTFQPNRGSSSAGIERAVVRAHLTVADDNPLWRSLGSVYPIIEAPAGDTAHADSESMWRLGRYFGHAIVEDVFGAWFAPLTVDRAYWITTAKFGLKFSEPVAIDAGTLIALGTLGNGKGIDVRQRNASTGADEALTVSSIAVGTDTRVIEVTLSGAPNGFDIRAFLASRTTGGNANGRTEGARSLVRSASAFDTDPLDAAALYKGIPHLVVPLPDRN